MFSTNVISAAGAVTNSMVGSGLPDSSSALGALLRLLGSFCVVVAILFALLWMLRRWQSAAATSGPRQELRIIESRSLGQRQSLHVVEVGSQRFLIAGSTAGIQMLSPLSPASQVPEPTPQSAPSPNPRSVPAPASFANALLQALGRTS
jgi:flagellar biosynthetic protein FliO